jgi:putative PIN family toxin of toxin-antitoxin system
MKLVLDTNILVSATLWDNSVSHKLLIRLIEKDTEIFTSLEILEEFRKVVLRDFQYEKAEAEYIISKLLNFLKIVKPDIKINIIKEDFSDNRILECAVSSDSEFILSYDKHLLKLKTFKDIKILTPEEFLKLLNNTK